MKNTKVVSKKSVSKSTKPATKKVEKKNVVEIFAKALNIPCPKCKVGKGKPCIYTQTNNGHVKGHKRSRPHPVRRGKVGTGKVVLSVKTKVQSIKKSA